MKPPICPICFRTSERDWFFRRGDWVQFADHQVRSDGMPGHPQGLEWFCERHLRAAQKRAALPLNQALAQMR